jgi:uroporphyrin-III C-methyltransferase / precorrin-2 dehydrogenase / sirohydrochlorin ferrochelatase
VSGFVWLVGAGPGDPELLTRRAARVLGEADLILYDALVDPQVLTLAPQARRFPVGKRAGRPSADQDMIQRLMIRQARRGRKVVRLKCGDPFVLGRGGEEALALAEAGVPFEVVPGLSSAVAAPALAGIPVTHRGLASGFMVVSGHAESGFAPALSSIAPGALTVVVLMGLGHREAIARLLLGRGWPAVTRAAILLGASTAAAHTWMGSLSELATAVLPDNGAPGTIVIGEVVGVAQALASHESGVLASGHGR